MATAYNIETNEYRGSLGHKKREEMKKWVNLWIEDCEQLEWDFVKEMLIGLRGKLDKENFSNLDYQYAVQNIKDAVNIALKKQYLYRYPNEKSKVLMSYKTDWEIVINKAPSTQHQILCAVDLWALQHYTASVFQFMRVLELGLGALANDVGLKFDVQNWYNIINEIEKKIKIERETLSKGAKKNARLQFLSESAKEFIYFKDGWRNYVSHNKCDYDEHSATSVMEHTRSFMITLASNLEF